MAKNDIALKTISELLGMNFFIPSYQRGYRWTTQQVNDLLNDICDFKPQKEEWYCLQPLVVKQKNDNEWEVIDGQQRLTTIFLIIHYFNEMWVGKQKITEPTITYKTRNDSFKFLKEMKVEDNNDVIINDTNIDYQHISSAYQAINNWVIEKKKGKFDENEFQSKFKEKTKIIWYETDPTQDGRDIFSRINMGKIPLTNAELIKALFLNSSNFKTENTIDEEQIYLKQLEIATEWDIIETALHDDEFWLFINKEENVKETRIEFLFELLVGLPYDKNNRLIKNDDYYFFREYQKKFTNNTEAIISDNWREVKRYFQTMQNWFENRELYHKIGFLIACLEISYKKEEEFIVYLNKLIVELIKKSLDKSEEGITKCDFVKLINDKIKSEMKNRQLDQMEYSKGTSVRKTLLLHNIQTMLNNKKENSRFPFNRYKREKWDIEHIHAIATEMPKTEQHQKDWLQQAKEFIDTKQFDLLNRVDNYSKDSFEQLFNNILNYFDENKKHEDINDLSNLVLLDAGTNRGYKNAVFPVKRKTIIKKEREGTFVPICTKNVFMKYYSPKIEQMTFWGETDRNEYFNNIKIVLESYLPKEESK